MRYIGGNISTTPGETTFIASGNIAAGDKLVLNDDGTVSAVSATGIAEVTGSVDTSISLGGLYYDITYCEDIDKVVLAYREDDANSNRHGKAVVGTINSNNTITWGTTVTFTTNEVQYIKLCSREGESGVILCYKDMDDNGYGRVTYGDITGNTIDFTNYDAGHFMYNSGTTLLYSLDLCWDSYMKVGIVVYRGGSNYPIIRKIYSNYIHDINVSSQLILNTQYSGDDLAAVAYDKVKHQIHAVVGEGSNRPRLHLLINRNTPSTVLDRPFETWLSEDAPWSTSHGPQSYRYHLTSYNGFSVFVQRDASSSGGSKGYITTFRVVNVSNTSVYHYSTAKVEEQMLAIEPASFGNTSPGDIFYDKHLNKAIVSYSYADDSDKPYFKIITVDTNSLDTSVSGRKAISTATSTKHARGICSNSGKYVFSYYDNSGNAPGIEVVVYQPQRTNLKPGNFVGIAEYPATNGSSVKVSTKGSIVNNQSNLIAGKKYYVQADGTLNTTKSNPEVTAGLALSATKLIIKG